MAPAVAVNHLLVGQHRATFRAPVHFALFAEGDALLEHAQEEPLVPVVVRGIAGSEFAAPVVAETEAAQNAAKFGDVLFGPNARRGVILDRSVFSGQAEGVETHRMQDVESGHALVAGDSVADRVIAHVAHVQGARGVRKHF